MSTIHLIPQRRGFPAIGSVTQKPQCCNLLTVPCLFLILGNHTIPPLLPIPYVLGHFLDAGGVLCLVRPFPAQECFVSIFFFEVGFESSRGLRDTRLGKVRFTVVDLTAIGMFREHIGRRVSGWVQVRAQLVVGSEVVLGTCIKR